MASISAIAGNTFQTYATQPAYKPPTTTASTPDYAAETLDQLRLQAEQGDIRAETQLNLEEDLFGPSINPNPASTVNFLA